jgi:chaperonin GroES
MRVLNDNVLVEVPLERKQTASGLYIPETAQDGQVIYGTVIKVGLGKMLDNGQRCIPSVTEGDTVYFPKFNATKVDIDGKTVYVVSEQQIVLVK